MIKKGKWENWSRTSASSPNQIIYPISIEEICMIIKDASIHNKKASENDESINESSS